MTASGTNLRTHVLNVVRGGLIGTVEVIPGPSGGTVALVTGVYDRLIVSAGHTLSGLRALASDLPRGRGSARAGEQFRQAHWGLVLTVLAGMVLAVVTAARIVAPLVENHPQRSFAVFFGLVLASLWVPYSTSGRRWTPANYLLAGVVAVVAFVLTGLPPSEADPNPPYVMLAAAFAICALVLPGLSGSFLLLTLGLYTPTIDAVNERDFGYLGTFAIGAVLGLAVVVKALQWLLERHHHLTLVVMTGLLAGSLRALWPWQPWDDEDDRTLLAPDSDVAVTVLLAALGVATVVAIIIAERRARLRRAERITVDT